jgi:hypothetical protein
MTVATVRLLAADPENYDRATAVGDGATIEFRVPSSPVVDASVTVFVANVAKTEGVEYTFNDALGVCTFTAGNIPGAGVEIVITYRHTLLSDASLGTLLILEGDDDRLAAAQALDIMASSEAIVQKKLKLLGGDLETDGPAVAKALREHAQRLRDQVESGAGDAAGALDVIEQVVDDFSARERITAEVLRGA